MIKTFIKKLLVFTRILRGRLNGAKLYVKKGTYIAKGVYFSKSRSITIGDGSYIGRYVSLSCHVEIGTNVLIASNVAFVGGDHRIDNINCHMIHSGRYTIKKIVIEDNVWIGHGAIIMHGTHLATGSVVGAGSVVTKNVSKNEIVAGNPAKHVRFRKA